MEGGTTQHLSRPPLVPDPPDRGHTPAVRIEGVHVKIIQSSQQGGRECEVSVFGGPKGSAVDVLCDPVVERTEAPPSDFVEAAVQQENQRPFLTMKTNLLRISYLILASYH